ncbi:hypothetical protein ABES22_12315, partial [Bacillus safensis]
MADAFSVKTNPRIRCQSCVLVLTNNKFAPRKYSSFLDFKGFLITLKRSKDKKASAQGLTPVFETGIKTPLY